MQKSLIRKGIIVGIVVLFFGAGVVLGIGNDIEKVNNVLDSDILNVNNGLVGYWSFDEVDGNIVPDESGYESYGVNHGATWVDGYSGKDFDFDGLDDYILVPDSNSIIVGAGDLTI